MNNVLPGWIDSLPATEERRKSVPLGHYGNADEVAATIAFLASDGAAYITGQNICVDGGAVRPPPRAAVFAKAYELGRRHRVEAGGQPPSEREHAAG